MYLNPVLGAVVDKITRKGLVQKAIFVWRLNVAYFNSVLGAGTKLCLMVNHK